MMYVCDSLSAVAGEFAGHCCIQACMLRHVLKWLTVRGIVSGMYQSGTPNAPRFRHGHVLHSPTAALSMFGRMGVATVLSSV